MLDSPPFSVSPNNRYNPTLSSYEKTFGLCLACFVPKMLVKKNISERVQASGGERHWKTIVSLLCSNR